jgi:hypothetical protein
MIVAFLVHEVTAIWDVNYATTARTVTATEQHVHSFLEMIPLMALLSVISLHWSQFLALFGVGPDSAKFDISWKAQPLPTGYILTLLALILLFEFLPYLEEFARGLRASGGKIIPAKARDAASGPTALR